MRERQPDWLELEGLLGRAKGRPERLGAEGVRRAGALYRAAVADLARARRAWPHDPARKRLEDLVSRARGMLYAATRPRGRAGDYLRAGYWLAVCRHRRPIALAWFLLAVSAALGLAWGWSDPAAASGVVPGSLAGGGGGPHQAIGLAAGQAAALSVSIFTNNIGVTFSSFAGGIALGLLPGLLLLYNGLLLGAVAGIAASTGHGVDVVELIAPHGMLELSCIAVCAAAGMRMGWTLVEPGTLTRREALTARAPESVLLVLATAPWLVVAGLVEGFVTPHHLPLAPALTIGLALAGAYWGLVFWRGRAPQSRSVRLARR